ARHAGTGDPGWAALAQGVELFVLDLAEDAAGLLGEPLPGEDAPLRAVRRSLLAECYALLGAAERLQALRSTQPAGRDTEPRRRTRANPCRPRRCAQAFVSAACAGLAAIAGRRHRARCLRRRSAMLVRAFTCSCTVAIAAAQSTLTVPQQYPTIAAAVLAASDGDTILVAAGNHRIDGVVTISRSLRLIGNNSLLYSTGSGQ